MKKTTVIFLAVLLTACTETPEQHEKSVARLAISNCWDDQSKKSLEPGEARFIAMACEKMENDFITKYGVKP
ncbi:hypothetical protein [Massilia phyllosphaerae]|uniref:hypothetical protein n=1 Tax=Massilia phyllosphaerae TaxID=3106034 RepID=UPI002B1CC99F|nr:hypothetical protein [Massilia sp. SGZ-792]